MTIDAAFTHFPTLTTSRLLVRQIGLRDAGAFFAIFSDEKAMRLYRSSPHRSLDESREEVTRLLGH